MRFRVLGRPSIVLFLMIATFASGVSSLAAPVVSLPDERWNAPGPGVVTNETGAPGEDLYIVLHQAPSLAQYRGEVPGLKPTALKATGGTRLNTKSAASLAYLDYLADQHGLLAAKIEAALGRPLELVYRYDAVLNGIAVKMTPQEAGIVANLRGVKRVSRNQPRELLTDNGPRWIGADFIWGEDPIAGECNGSCGEGVVVGVIDTGINFDHPSFAEVGPVDGYVHSNPRGQFFGLCDPVLGLPFCNDKLIGYYDFTAEPGGPDDLNGHGSHTASTAAGNVVDASITTPTTTFERRISGVAPHANIIAYKACGAEPAGVLGCFPTLAPLLAAINQATLDQVDVINYSIGGGSGNPWADEDAQAFFDAYSAGIFVATSAGNEGPGVATLGSPADAPWVTAVGASTHDRLLQNGVIDIDPFLPDIFGKSLTAGTDQFNIVYAGDYQAVANPGATANLCGSGTGNPATGEGSGGDPFPPGTFRPNDIVICDRGEYGRVFKGIYVQRGGAGGYILANDAANGNSLVGDPHVLPAVHITFDDGVILKNHVAANSVGATGAGDSRDCTVCVTGKIKGTNPEESPANGDIMAGFSSRGFNPAVPDVIKPDVTAPGVDIFAAFNTPAGSVPPTDPEYGIISGTSMSSPHTAGAGALVIGAHPDWTPDEVKSALMSTAFTSPPGTGSESHPVFKEDGQTPADPFDMGGGRVDLRQAADAGLIMNVGAAAYEAANPALGGDAATLNIASLGQDDCLQSCSWTRTVEATVASTWTASTTAPAGMVLTVSPVSFTLAAGEAQTITVTADVAGVTPKNQWTFAEVRLSPSDAFVPETHFPVAVIPTSEGGVPLEVLHLHGNLHDDCEFLPGYTGSGAADLLNGCDPFMSPDPGLDPTAPPAKWGPVEPAVNGSAPQNIHDPNWIWLLDEPTTLQGPMVLEFWAAGPLSNPVFSADFFIRLYADGVLHLQERVSHTLQTPNVAELLSSTVQVPRVTADSDFIVQIDPVFIDTQQGSFIYYDSVAPCPGASGPCDSRIGMPVVRDTTLPPVANPDSAQVLSGGTVTIDVTANDFDPEGGPLVVDLAGLAPPANGSAEVTFGNAIEYTHDGSATSSDTFQYRITDNQGLSALGTVSIAVLNQCFNDAGDASDDFETGAPGWTVDTAVLAPPSQTWMLTPDPFATSPTTVWFTDALAQEPTLDTSKDVRLVSPAHLLSPASHLTFFHRFSTEPAFDGGVLELSLDDGASWQDVEDAGGVFVAGGYNSVLGSAGSGFALGGRDGWSGDSPGFLVGQMNSVDVDLGALAGETVRVRFRMGQDQLFGQPGGWWIDDVTFTNRWEQCPAENPVAIDDADTVAANGTVNTDVKANDFDPDTPNAFLTVEIMTQGSHGTATVEADGTVTYDHDDGNLATSDFYEYRLSDPEGNFDTAIVTITIEHDNPAPDAVDDAAIVAAGGSTTIDVKANDSDPNHSNDELTVTLETTPEHGTAGVTADGQITYTHNNDTATEDSFRYRLTDPLGAFDIATVTITIDRGGATSAKVAGGGYLLSSDGDKINFGFNAKNRASGPQGNLTLHDKAVGVKVKLTDVTSLTAIDGSCGPVAAGSASAQFTGSGTFNDGAAEFRVCVADLGEPGNGSDRFYLECTSGCGYDTAARSDDAVVDGGNIQVHSGGGSGASQHAKASGSAASVLILDPMFATDGEAGELREFSVRAYGANGELMNGAAVTLTIQTAAGPAALQGISSLAGLAHFSYALAAGEMGFEASSGAVTSNVIEISGF